VTRLKPKVIETFDTIAGAYKRLRRLQDQDIQFQLKRLSLSPAQERTYKKLKNEIIGGVKSLRLNQARTDRCHRSGTWQSVDGRQFTHDCAEPKKGENAFGR